MKKYSLILVVLLSCTLASYSQDEKETDVTVTNLRLKARELKKQANTIDTLCNSITLLKSKILKEALPKDSKSLQSLGKSKFYTGYTNIIPDINNCIALLSQYRSELEAILRKLQSEYGQPGQKQVTEQRKAAPKFNLKSRLDTLKINFTSPSYYSCWHRNYNNWKSQSMEQDDVDLLELYNKVMSMQLSLLKEYNNEVNNRFLKEDFDKIKAGLREQHREAFDRIALNICDYEYIWKEFEAAKAWKQDSRNKKKPTDAAIQDINRIPYTKQEWAKLNAPKVAASLPSNQNQSEDTSNGEGTVKKGDINKEE